MRVRVDVGGGAGWRRRLGRVLGCEDPSMCRGTSSHGVAIVTGTCVIRLVNLIKRRRRQAFGASGRRLGASRVGKCHVALAIDGLSAVWRLRHGLLALCMIR